MSRRHGQNRSRYTASKRTAQRIPPTSRNLAAARAFVEEKWKERATELGRDRPTDLSGACKFASLFAQALFGGELRGNWHHQFVVVGHPAVAVDLTDAAGVPSGFERLHDKQWWGNREHAESLRSIRPRILRWVDEFSGWVESRGIEIDR